MKSEELGLVATQELDDLGRSPSEVPAGTARLIMKLIQVVEVLPPEELPGFLVALSACLGQLSARLLEAASTPATADRDENLSVEEAARRLGVSPDYLYRNHGRLPFTRRIGRRLLFSSRGLESWNAKRR
jgi:excisionase family DNA binding protein